MKGTIMIQGTMSGVGKSLLVAGLCRILREDGVKAAPFKSQNMALNSYITSEGLEIGRAQAMQAEAAGIRPRPAMNPVLLKPTSDRGSQVIVGGEVRAQMSASEYFSYRKQLIPEILAAYRSLREQYDVIVIEGAGSPAEINLKRDDIVNMGLAELVDAPVVLAGDIDRGGVFAQLYGTLELLERKERDRVKGLIVNRFRGDPSLFSSGVRMLEDLTEKPVLGVVPYLPVHLEDEDSISDRLERTGRGRGVDLAVIRLPRISNYTDFNPFETMDNVSVRYVSSAEQLQEPDVLFIPGTKNTIQDLLWLRQTGLEAAILKLHAAGTPVVGICGGYQMLGKTISDEAGTEGGGKVRGMGLLDIETVFGNEKVRTRVRGSAHKLTGTFAALSGRTAEGYEIHMGRSARLEGVPAFCTVTDEVSGITQEDGAVGDHVFGTYLHGVFDNGEMAEALIQAVTGRKTAGIPEDYRSYKERQYRLLADGMRNSLDLSAVYRIIEDSGRL